jgi:hypothetical protein
MKSCIRHDFILVFGKILHTDNIKVGAIKVHFEDSPRQKVKGSNPHSVILYEEKFLKNYMINAPHALPIQSMLDMYQYILS